MNLKLIVLFEIVLVARALHRHRFKRCDWGIIDHRPARPPYDLCQRNGWTTGTFKVLDRLSVGECRHLARSAPGICEDSYDAIVRERSEFDLALRQCEAKAGSVCKIVWHGCS
jgi:hypothetical protein